MTRALCSWSAGRRGQPLATMRGVLLLFMASLVACSASAPTLRTGLSAATSTASATAPAVDPYRGLPNVPRFRVTSNDVVDRKPMPVEQLSGLGGVPGGKDSSPQLTWTGFPAATKSFVVTVFDPDAPTGSGFWHWAVMDIPPSTHSLPSGAGSPDSGLLPAPAVQLPNDAGLRRYFGAAPSPGSGVHRYFITVTALDVASTGVDPSSSPALLTASIAPHTLGRGYLVPTAQR